MPAGITPGGAFTEVGGGELAARFGPRSMRAPLSNVAGTTVTGPYPPWKVIGPRLSPADRGAAFGTNARKGVCVRFPPPVPNLAPGCFLPHPGAALTVSGPEGPAKALGWPDGT